MIGRRTRFRENDDLPLWRGPAAKKKPPFFNARVLITREIMRSRDVQCNTGEVCFRLGKTYKRLAIQFIRLMEVRICLTFKANG